ncbi:hypothetical protein B0O80DRAFT_456487 [Mortierella sp. GBAus27b]|nr:hypothetical protein B0O80DRAFT_456487 [Mortierella sp. GBAus27b]
MKHWSYFSPLSFIRWKRGCVNIQVCQGASRIANCIAGSIAGPVASPVASPVADSIPDPVFYLVFCEVKQLPNSDALGPGA